MTATFAAAAQQDPGWGKLIALLLTVGVFWASTAAHKRWQQVKTVDLPSPDHGPKALNTVKPQVNADSDSDFGPAGGGGGDVVPLRRRPLDEFVADRDGRQPASTIVREATRELKVSESSAWRALRRFKGKVDPGDAA
jgi:hypothetical protein